MSKKVYSLFQLSKSIKNVLRGYATQSYWVKAEILKLNYYEQSGHAYPDLVDKRQDSIKAQFRGTIWSSKFKHINTKFNSIGEELKDDMLVVIKVSVNYHSIYGLTLNILDVDTDYTLGELARLKQESIKRLKNEGLFAKNKAIHLALIPKTIAVISVESSKGYKDFVDVLDNNPQRFQFHYKVFPAVLQGHRAVETISRQLKYINHFTSVFDAVAIIRGGGDEVGFSAYDQYALAKSITECSLPVLTGIGHSTNKTVSEMVSYKSFITPTKLAEFLIDEFDHVHKKLLDDTKVLQTISSNTVFQQKRELNSLIKLFENQVNSKCRYESMMILQLQNDIEQKTKTLLNDNKNALQYFGYSIKSEFKDFIKSEKKVLSNFAAGIQNLSHQRLIFERTRLKTKIESLSRQAKLQLILKDKSLDLIFHQLRLQDPKHILNRGFSLTKINGKLIKDTKVLKKGDRIETQYYKGKTESEIRSIN